MKNKKGFTLVELIAVLIILAALALVTFPALLNQISNIKGKINSSTEELLLRAAKSYVNDNLNSFPKINRSVYCIDLDSLVNNNYLSDTSISSIDGLSDKAVKVVYDGTYNYTIDSLSNCIDEKESNHTPKYYTWVNGTHEISDGLPSEATTDLSGAKGYRIYIGLDSSDGNTINTEYVCFKTSSDGPQYCLIGNKPDAYDYNKRILDEAFPDSCVIEDEDSRYVCEKSILYADVWTDGCVEIYTDHNLCRVDNDGQYECY